MKFGLIISIQFVLLILVQCVKNQFHPFSKFRDLQHLKQTYEDSLTTENFVVHIGSHKGLKAADKISRLLGQPSGYEFNQYSGYITVDPDHGRVLFYYFVESRNNSDTKPLVLWLNGGPGCSSIGGGAMMELGPFRVNKDGKTLSINKYSWVEVANILFLESPAGVGFSYSNTSTDYKTTGDTQTALDSYTFLINWLKRFPEYETRDFYITGESYAGHYIPQLALLILRSNNHTPINLKGIAIGNAYVDEETQNKGTHDFWWYRSMVSDEIHDGIVKNCNFSWKSVLSEDCKAFINEENKLTGNIFSYDIYGPLCINGTSAKQTTGFDPCTQDYIQSYLNIPQVQISLHANLTGLPGPWQDCNDDIFNNWTDQPFTMLPTIQRLLGSGIRFWIYSGDVDSNVAVTTTKYAINKLNTTIKTPWYPCFKQPNINMKATLVFSIILALLAFVQCVRKQFDPFSKFIELQNLKKTYDSPELTTEDFVVHVASHHGMKEADKITRLPGQPKCSKFNQYSGYVTVDPHHGRALFYYFAEATHKSSEKPLVLWLNGGPGCSSIGGGTMMELGPFRVNKDGKTLSLNKYSWNKVGNMLFLESPAGVGFSYSNRSSDYESTGDSQTAKDSYTFLINWLERFPEYKTRDFYITGESYAGHYIPQLAQLILRSNHRRNDDDNSTFINLKGIAIGNAYIDDETQGKGRHDFLWSRSMVSDEIHDGIVKNCDYSWNSVLSDICKAYINQENYIVGNVFAYEIYAPLCFNGTSAKTTGFDPCTQDYIESYMNNPQVQKSLHANLTNLPGHWQDCNEDIFNNWSDQPFTMLPTIQRLMESGIRFWIYSGDIDSIVPVTTTQYAIKKLNSSIKTPWYPWYLNGEVGGYVVEYENLTFLTVRGAGHFVPSYQPDRALALFSSFLDGKPPVSL
ncbi:hypothetical protein E3N88_06177 [Mikania micrantha]|uniref:Carboxypeptidase n=1 Tax=Mikania micrantha TaxID=192012 RepID=A0A5N6PNR1_9ASTR|nr:hypothetical protein E3N88_06177 [Mikania micrantha]